MKRGAACHLENFRPWVKSQDAYGTFTEQYGERESKEFQDVCLNNGSATKAAFVGEFIELIKEFGYCAFFILKKKFSPGQIVRKTNTLDFIQKNKLPPQTKQSLIFILNNMIN
jgi:hypothetical protein